MSYSLYPPSRTRCRHDKLLDQLCQLMIDLDNLRLGRQPTGRQAVTPMRLVCFLTDLDRELSQCHSGARSAHGDLSREVRDWLMGLAEALSCEDGEILFRDGVILVEWTDLWKRLRESLEGCRQPLVAHLETAPA